MENVSTNSMLRIIADLERAAEICERLSRIQDKINAEQRAQDNMNRLRDSRVKYPTKRLSGTGKSYYEYPAKVGEVVHLHSMRGMYEITAVDPRFVDITCKKWTLETLRGDRRSCILRIQWKDVKCLAGGMNNIATFLKK